MLSGAFSFNIFSCLQTADSARLKERRRRPSADYLRRKKSTLSPLPLFPKLWKIPSLLPLIPRSGSGGRPPQVGAAAHTCTDEAARTAPAQPSGSGSPPFLPSFPPRHSSESKGTATSAENSYNFGGVSLYAGWNLDSLNVMASVGYTMADHDVDLSLPSALGMGNANADVDTNAFVADLRAEYQINTSVVDILPHAGVRYTALNTESHDLKINGSTLNSVASDTQHIVQFPIGVTVSKDIAVAGWNVKPQADVSVIPAAGEKKNTTKVSYSGVNAVDSVNTRIMDSTSWSGMVGVQAEKGNFALGLNYGIQASSHETDQNVNVGFSWKF